MSGYIFYSLTALISVGCFVAGLIVARRKKHLSIWAVAALVILLIKAVLHLKPVWEAALFPWANYAYLQSYWLYPLAMFFFGLAIPQLPVKWNRAVIMVLVVALFGFSLWHERWMIISSDDSSIQRADADHHCVQTTHYTCAPAACVSLLSYWNIDATEGEMVRLCLTRKNGGTTLFNIYRGLVMKTRGSDLRVKLMETDLDTLAEIGKPAIIGTDHAVTINFTDKGIVVHNPLNKKPVVMTREAFLKTSQFNGEVVLVAGDRR